MDNNQQSNVGGTQQPAAANKVSEGVIGTAPAAPAKTDLGVNNAGTMNTGTPFTGQDVSMTTPQRAGGNITTTEPGSK